MRPRGLSGDTVCQALTTNLCHTRQLEKRRQRSNTFVQQHGNFTTHRTYCLMKGWYRSATSSPRQGTVEGKGMMKLGSFTVGMLAGLAAAAVGQELAK